MKKPAITAQLIKEKAIGAIQGWTDTINWTTQSVANLKGKEGEIEIDWGDGSHPTISISADFEGGGGGGGITGIKFIGTDGSNATIGSTDDPYEVSFASETDSNVTVKVSTTTKGVKLTLGVYYV